MSLKLIVAIAHDVLRILAALELAGAWLDEMLAAFVAQFTAPRGAA